MSIHWTNLRREFRPMMALGAPMVVAEIGWMAMGVVDTVMSGPLGAAAVGAGSLGHMLFYPVVTWGIAMLLGMDTLVAQAFGAGKEQDCRHTLVNGLWMALAAAPVLSVVVLGLAPLLSAVGTNAHVMALLDPYLRSLMTSILPLLLFTACRRYLQAIDVVKPVTFALVSANIVNFVGNWALMYGHWGFRAMGLAGSGWSTSFARLYMLAVVAGAVVWHERKTGNLLWLVSWRPDGERLRELFRLGMPSAVQFGLEGAVFGLVSVLAARLHESALAAHGIAVQVIATTYMVPLGLSSATAVRVGQAVGRRDRDGVLASGWGGLLLGCGFMSVAGVALWTVPGMIMRRFIDDAAVIGTGQVLLRVAAFLELFDGLQAVATGALRGLGDTRTPAAAHFIGYWLVGLPVAYVLGFPYGWGVTGIWVGLTVALILIGILLVGVWRYRSARWQMEKIRTTTECS